MINLVISPSQQSWNKCAVGDSEENHMRTIGEELYTLLKQDTSFNPYLIQDLEGNESYTLSKTVELSNQFILDNGGTGYHLALHSDGGYSGSGSSGFYLSENGKNFGRPIYEEVCAYTPWGDMSFSQRTGLYELKYTDAVAFLLEVSFHDQPIQAQWIHDNAKNIAYAIAKGIYRAVGLEMPLPTVNWEQKYKDLLNQYYGFRKSILDVTSQYI